jgi:hypothetical protein
MLRAAVRPDSNQIVIEVGSDKATSLKFTNSLPGPVTLSADERTGLKIEIADPKIAAGKSTSVTFRYDAERGARPSTVTFTVSPTGQKIPIQVIYAVNNH